MKKKTALMYYSLLIEWNKYCMEFNFRPNKLDLDENVVDEL